MSKKWKPEPAAGFSRRMLLAGAGGVMAHGAIGHVGPAVASLAPSEETWNDIKGDLFDNLTFADGADIIAIDAPKRAHDASIVPIDIQVGRNQDIQRLTVVIDENPAPLAAKFTFGPSAGGASVKTRMRINAYSYVRVVAEAGDGTQFMVKRFVKASGGCAAPSGKDPVAAKENMGKMRLRRFAEANPREAQIMIRHPNHSGFQMDQVSMLYIPPDFIETIRISQGDEMIMTVEGGISLSEDPNLRFFYREDPGTPIDVTIRDTEGRVFTKTWASNQS